MPVIKGLQYARHHPGYKTCFTSLDPYHKLQIGIIFLIKKENKVSIHTQISVLTKKLS